MRMGKRRAGCLALFLLCAAGLAWLLAAETVPRREPARLTPTAVTGAPGLDGLYLYEGPLTLEYALPERAEGLRPILEIRQLYAAAELRLDGAPLQRLPAGLGNLYVTLPPDWGGKTLALAMEKGPEDPVPSLYLTDSVVMNEQARADTSLLAFPAAVFGVLSLLALGLFLYGWLEGAKPWPALLLSIAALGQAAYFYLQNFSLFSLPPALYGLALYQSRALLFAAPPLYLLLGMKKRRKAFAPFAVLPSLFYFVTAGFQTVVPLFSGIAVHAGLAFCPTVAALLVCAALEYRDGNPVFRRFLPWLGGCAAAVVLLSMLPAARTSILWAFLADPILWIDTELFYWNSLLLALCFLDSAVALIRRVAQRETEMRVLSARESLTREQLAVVRESAAALGELRHEVKNHYLVLQNLSRAGESKRLDAYLSTLVSDMASIPALTCAPHPAINAVLTTMLARAQKQGIAVERRVDIPETLPFPDTELCAVLMNLLQNALEANAQAPEGARKWLRVDLHIRGFHLYIGVENSCFAPVDYDGESGLYRTTKEDPSAHGYGLKAVQAVARKYRSELLLQCSDGVFSAATALQIPE
ncbi:sensor histidine kinase [uncultured Oscillibacter sp.]|uniref:sensor histidine kinase n=1 Tax=uncultured Oscillibacter sp. TaxID=876091 RepID=UPI002634931C|nr:GHKL domain-containing protein [uncultured Oscillibacter sp.]